MEVFFFNRVYFFLADLDWVRPLKRNILFKSIIFPKHIITLKI